MEPLPSVPVGQQIPFALRQTVVPLLEHSLQEILGNLENATLEFPDLPGPNPQPPSTLGTGLRNRTEPHGMGRITSLKQEHPGESEVTGHSARCSLACLHAVQNYSPLMAHSWPLERVAFGWGNPMQAVTQSHTEHGKVQRPSSTVCGRPHPGSRVTTQGHTFPASPNLACHPALPSSRLPRQTSGPVQHRNQSASRIHL